MSCRVGVLGGGAWGTALGSLLTGKGHEVLLWAREEEVVRSIQVDHENKIFLPGIPLPEDLTATSSLKEACRDKDLLVSVMPAQFARSVLSEAAPFLDGGVPIVSASKGIETSSLKLLNEVFEEILPGSSESRLCFLSGPNFAREIAQGLPAGATLASLNTTVARKAQEAISTPLYKLYLSSDIVGVEVGGAVKNVIAIAAGIVDGLSLGSSLRASMITRGLSEMTRLGVALGANPLTFSGLSGVGDLILTCTSDLSRNRTLGLELSQGKSLTEILGSRKAATEGVATTEAVHKLAQKFSLDLPICEGVYQILYQNKSCLEALQSHAARSLKSELEEIGS
jgi:glycerol-3-phosphate dehydrogenase (NAD(P)+)